MEEEEEVTESLSQHHNAFEIVKPSASRFVEPDLQIHLDSLPKTKPEVFPINWEDPEILKHSEEPAQMRKKLDTGEESKPYHLKSTVLNIGQEIEQMFREPQSSSEILAKVEEWLIALTSTLKEGIFEIFPKILREIERRDMKISVEISSKLNFAHRFHQAIEKKNRNDRNRLMEVNEEERKYLELLKNFRTEYLRGELSTSTSDDSFLTFYDECFNKVSTSGISEKTYGNFAYDLASMIIFDCKKRLKPLPKNYQISQREVFLRTVFFYKTQKKNQNMFDYIGKLIELFYHLHQILFLEFTDYKREKKKFAEITFPNEQVLELVNEDCTELQSNLNLPDFRPLLGDIFKIGICGTRDGTFLDMIVDLACCLTMKGIQFKKEDAIVLLKLAIKIEPACFRALCELHRLQNKTQPDIDLLKIIIEEGHSNKQDVSMYELLLDDCGTPRDEIHALRIAYQRFHSVLSPNPETVQCDFKNQKINVILPEDSPLPQSYQIFINKFPVHIQFIHGVVKLL